MMVYMQRQTWKPVRSKKLRKSALGTYRFSRPVGTDNDGDWALELDDICVLVIKSSDASNGELVERSPKQDHQSS